MQHWCPHTIEFMWRSEDHFFMLFHFCLFDAEQLVSLLDSAQLCTPSYLAHDLPSDSLVAVSHLARGVL